MTRKQKPETGSQQAMNTAVRLLTRRDHTRYEVRQKLKQRGFSAGAIRAAVTECERLNYIDDERTARIYIGQLVRRGFGFRRIAAELKKKGLQTAVGDEGGFAPNLRSKEEAMESIQEGIKKAVFKPGKEIIKWIDAAASEFYSSK